MQGREFEVKGQFSQLKYWVLDAPPTSDDKLCQALQWVPLSEQVRAAPSMGDCGQCLGPITCTVGLLW